MRGKEAPLLLCQDKEAATHNYTISSLWSSLLSCFILTFTTYCISSVDTAVTVKKTTTRSYTESGAALLPHLSSREEGSIRNLWRHPRAPGCQRGWVPIGKGIKEALVLQGWLTQPKQQEGYWRCWYSLGRVYSTGWGTLSSSLDSSFSLSSLRTH